MKKQPDLSIIFSSGREREALLFELLEIDRVFENWTQSYEIVVATFDEEGKLPETLKALQKIVKELEFVSHSEEYPAAYLLKQALAMAKGRSCLLVDTTLPFSWEGVREDLSSDFHEKETSVWFLESDLSTLPEPLKTFLSWAHQTTDRVMKKILQSGPPTIHLPLLFSTKEKISILVESWEEEESTLSPLLKIVRTFLKRKEKVQFLPLSNPKFSLRYKTTLNHWRTAWRVRRS